MACDRRRRGHGARAGVGARAATCAARGRARGRAVRHRRRSRLFAHRGRSGVAAQVREASPVDARCARQRRAGCRAPIASRSPPPWRRAATAGLDASLRETAALYVGATTAGMRRDGGGVPPLARRRGRRFRVSRMLAHAALDVGAAREPGARRVRTTRDVLDGVLVERARDRGRRGGDRARARPRSPRRRRRSRSAASPTRASTPCRRSTRSRAGRSTATAAACRWARGPPRSCSRTPTTRAAAARACARCVARRRRRADAHHVTAPHPEGAGARRALEAALAERGGVAPDAVDYVNAHGSGTTHNDEVEVAALRAVFGDAPAAGAGQLEQVAGRALSRGGGRDRGRRHRAWRSSDGVLPPTVTLRDARRRLDRPRPRPARGPPRVARRRGHVVVGFGGHNVTLVLARPGGAGDGDVAITGIGVVSAFGVGDGAVLGRARRSGAVRPTRAAGRGRRTHGPRCRSARRRATFVRTPLARRIDRTSLLALAACAARARRRRRAAATALDRRRAPASSSAPSLGNLARDGVVPGPALRARRGKSRSSSRTW